MLPLVTSTKRNGGRWRRHRMPGDICPPQTEEITQTGIFCCATSIIMANRRQIPSAQWTADPPAAHLARRRTNQSIMCALPYSGFWQGGVLRHVQATYKRKLRRKPQSLYHPQPKQASGFALFKPQQQQQRAKGHGHFWWRTPNTAAAWRE